MRDESFPKVARVKSSRDFERAFKKGVVVADDTLVLHALDTKGSAPRLGIGVAKRTGNAPMRNRWKRLIRESFRRSRHSFPALDFIVRPKKGAICDYQRIANSLPRLVKRAEKKLISIHKASS